MSLDQMFAMLRNWGEQHSAFGQTAHVERAAVTREPRADAEGKKADPDLLPSRATRVVLETQIERGIASPPGKAPVPRRERPDRRDTAAKG